MNENPMEKPKPYEPNEEEIKKAEEMMTEEQKEMSKERKHELKELAHRFFEIHGAMRRGEYITIPDFSDFYSLRDYFHLPQLTQEQFNRLDPDDKLNLQNKGNFLRKMAEKWEREVKKTISEKDKRQN